MSKTDVEAVEDAVASIGMSSRGVGGWLDEMNNPISTKASWHSVKRVRIHDDEELFDRDRRRCGVRWIDECSIDDTLIGTINQTRVGFLDNVFCTDDNARFESTQGAIRHLLQRMEQGFVYERPKGPLGWIKSLFAKEE